MVFQRGPDGACVWGEGSRPAPGLRIKIGLVLVVWMGDGGLWCGVLHRKEIEWMSREQQFGVEGNKTCVCMSVYVCR